MSHKNTVAQSIVLLLLVAACARPMPAPETIALSVNATLTALAPSASPTVKPVTPAVTPTVPPPTSTPTAPPPSPTAVQTTTSTPSPIPTPTATLTPVVVEVPPTWRQYEDPVGAFTMYYPPEWKVSGQNLNKVAFELPGLTILIVEVSQLQTKMSDQDTQDALVAVAVQDQFAKGNMVTNVEKGVWEHYPQGHYVLLDVEGDDSRASQTLYVVSYLGDTNVGSANLFKLWAKITDAEKETVAAVFASIRPKDWGTGGPSAIVEATPLPIATPQVMAEKVVNLRAGPGTNYPKAGATEAGDKLTVVGRTADGSWLEVCCVNEKTVWVAASVVTILGDAKSVSVAKTIPTPPPAPTRVPTSPPAPLAGLHQRQTIGTWEIQPERVHKEKAVYLYGDSYVAMGNYAIVIVLAKNVASGTQDLAQTLALALKDDKGRLYSYSDPYTTERYANQAACWEFVVHPSPFHEISPGEETPLLMLWDVKEDVQSLTLYIEDERGNAAQWNLGDFSDIPPFKK